MWCSNCEGGMWCATCDGGGVREGKCFFSNRCGGVWCSCSVVGVRRRNRQ